jgi:NADH-quinone oxidoreductase subunit J
MLLNLGHGDEMVDIQRNGVRVAAGGLGLALLAVLLAAVGGRNGTLVPSGAAVVTYDAAAPVNVVSPVAAVLFREQLLAFEITSVLLLAAIVGAVVLAKRRAAA